MRLLECIKSGSGLYTFREASIYAQIPIATLRYWFIGSKLHPPVRSAVVDEGGMRYITFKDFIEAVAIRELRTEFGIPLPKIREAVLEARSRYKIEYPFSDKTRQTKTDGQELHIFLNDNQQIIQISGKQKRQASLQTVVVPFMKALIYDERGIGYEYVAADYGFTKITLNPGVMFGSPRVKDSPFSALTLWRAKNAEGDIDKVAELYKLNPRTVSASCKYCEENLRLAA